MNLEIIFSINRASLEKKACPQKFTMRKVQVLRTAVDFWQLLRSFSLRHENNQRDISALL
jgi:hypothetical protein